MLKDGSKVVVACIKIAAAAVICTLYYRLLSFYVFGGRFLGFTEDGATVEEVDIVTGETVPPDMLLEWLGIERDTPLFDRGRGFFENNLRRRLDKVMNSNHTLASLSIRGDFGGKVVVRAVERIPVARLGNRNLGIDHDGNVFDSRRAKGLIAIEGTLPQSLEPGSRVVPTSLDISNADIPARGRSIPSSMIIAALRLIDCLDGKSTQIPLSAIRAINVDSNDYLKLFFKDGRVAKIRWDCMKSAVETDGRDYLVAQLNGLYLIMTSPAGRSGREIDVQIKGHGYAR